MVYVLVIYGIEFCDLILAVSYILFFDVIYFEIFIGNFIIYWLCVFELWDVVIVYS